MKKINILKLVLIAVAVCSATSAKSAEMTWRMPAAISEGSFFYKNFMERYTQYINKDTGNGFIFKFVRNIQDDATKNSVILTNCSKFYFFLIKHRDKLKAA